MIDWHGPSRQPCPACDRGGRDRALSITHNADGSSIAHCFRCEFVETTGGERRPGIAPARPVAPVRHATLSTYGRELWAACSPVSEAARDYLEARGCCIPPADGDLRCHPALPHPSGYVGPGLVGLLSDVIDGTARSLFRAWISADGTRAAVDGNRLLLKNHRKAGTVCRLWGDDFVTHGLGIGEGLETTLSLAHGGGPAWACIDSSNMASFPVLGGVECLTIAADADPAGIAAATSCAARWHAAGRTVFVVTAPTAGADMNDIAREVPA